MTGNNIVLDYGIKVAKLLKYAFYTKCSFHCFAEYVGLVVWCEGASMEPTIEHNSIVFAERINLYNRVSRGDIIITKNPYNPKRIFCKRVIGLAGDKIHSEIIPRGYIWVEGDNKEASLDSRDFGPMPLGLVQGRVVGKLLSLPNLNMFKGNTEQGT